MKPTLYLLVVHGSSDPEAAQASFELLANFRAKLAEDESAELSFLERNEPLLEDSLKKNGDGYADIVLVPVVLFAAGHYKNDLSLALSRARAQYPQTSFRVAAALGIDAELVQATQAKVCLSSDSKSALIVVGRGSSDPDANGDFWKFLRLVGEGVPHQTLFGAVAGITQPLFADVLHQAAAQRPQKITVLPHLLFPGIILDAIKASVASFVATYPWIPVELLSPIGAGRQVAEILYRRAQKSEMRASENACDTCHYRVPIAGDLERVGGLRSLLWTIRHRHVHAQLREMPHAHAKVQRHLFVCHGKECTANESPALALHLRTIVQDAGLRGLVRVSQTSCFGRCSKGPIVAVYPDGIWYQEVKLDDAATLFSEHVQNERIVPRLISAILEP